MLTLSVRAGWHIAHRAEHPAASVLHPALAIGPRTPPKRSAPSRQSIFTAKPRWTPGRAIIV
jgi:hypothetical protein